VWLDMALNPIRAMVTESMPQVVEICDKRDQLSKVLVDIFMDFLLVYFFVNFRMWLITRGSSSSCRRPECTSLPQTIGD